MIMSSVLSFKGYNPWHRILFTGKHIYSLSVKEGELRSKIESPKLDRSPRKDSGFLFEVKGQKVP